jgi:hypothetical protein
MVGKIENRYISFKSFVLKTAFATTNNKTKKYNPKTTILGKRNPKNVKRREVDAAHTKITGTIWRHENDFRVIE